jgi:DNA modification methylase
MNSNSVMKSTQHKAQCADSRLMDFVQNSSIALVITSPPYPMIEMWDLVFGDLNKEIVLGTEHGDPHGAFELMHRELDAVWAQVDRVTIPGGMVCVNVGDATRTIAGLFRMYPNAERITGAFRKLGFDVLPRIIWRKTTNAPTKFMGSGMLPSGAYVTLEHEYVLLFRKGGRRDYSTPEKRRNRYESAYFWEERNSWFSDVWTSLNGTDQTASITSSRDRSGAYPMELPYRLINMFSVKGDTVLDPFLGTGTTTLAAMASARNSVGIEIDSAFADVVCGRIKREWASLNDRIHLRLGNHMDYIQQHREKGKAIRYENSNYRFPVITRQESELLFDWLERVERIAGGFTVYYSQEQSMYPPGTMTQLALFDREGGIDGHESRFG